MNSNRHDMPTRERQQRSRDRGPRTPDVDAKQTAAAAPSDVLEGQLGPDELPDATEVKLNQEARLHH